MNQNLVVKAAENTVAGGHPEHDYVRNFIGVSKERSEILNKHVIDAANLPNRTGKYVAQVIASASEIVENAAELAYVAYVVGCVIGQVA